MANRLLLSTMSWPRVGQVRPSAIIIRNNRYLLESVFRDQRLFYNGIYKERQHLKSVLFRGSILCYVRPIFVRASDNSSGHDEF